MPVAVEEGLPADRLPQAGPVVQVVRDDRAVLAVAAYGVFSVLPRELTPDEDRGRVSIMALGPEGAGFDYTYAAVQKIETGLKACHRCFNASSAVLFRSPAQLAIVHRAFSTQP